MEKNVSDKEILQFDPMVTKVIQAEILKYWGVNAEKVYNDTVMIGRFGMTFQDLLQYGRLVVFKQIKWFKKHGFNTETGEIKNAKMTTLIYQQLRNKFMSLSRSYSNSKHGGQVINVDENREILQRFIDTFDHSLNVDENATRLRESVKTMNKDIQMRCQKEFKSNTAILKFLKEMMLVYSSVSHVNFEASEMYVSSDGQSDPEIDLLMKREVEQRLNTFKRKNNIEKMTLVEYVDRKKDSPPHFFSGDKISVLMKLALERGFTSQKDVANHLGIGMTTLSNIIHGRSKGTAEFRQRLQTEFGKTLEELIQVTTRQ